MKFILVILPLLLFFSVFYVCAQEQDSVLVQITTLDGNEFVGNVIQEDDKLVVLSTSNLGDITIQKSDIKSRTFVRKEQFKAGKLWFDNPQATRYFWAPNAYGLKKGEGYYQNIYVLWNQCSVGITDNFSLGGGLIPLFLFGGGPTPVFITSKLSIPLENEKVNIGAGALVGTVLGENAGTFGIVYGLSTFGSRDNNVSLGIGYGFADGDWANSPLINLSGLFRLSNRAYFITENYYLNVDDNGGGIVGLGGRWIIKKASLDFMLGFPFGVDNDSFIAIPAIGFSIPF